MTEFDSAKIVVDWKCNLKCFYCCNNLPEVIDTFKPLTLEELVETNYKNYGLTGGEVLLPDVFKSLKRVMSYIPESGNIYIYTNGTQITNDTVTYYGEILSEYNVKGISLGVHSQELDWGALYKMHSLYIPIKIWVLDREEYNIPLMYGWNKNKPFDITIWKLDDDSCNNVTTDRFFMKGL